MGKVKGKFQVDFDDEKSFKFFKKEFSKCVLHFKTEAGADANLTNLKDSGGFKYNVDFEANLKCDGVLKFVNLAIKKTMPGPKSDSVEDFQVTGDYVQDTMATLVLTASGFKTELLSCGL
jgi:hypothetical protein